MAAGTARIAACVFAVLAARHIFRSLRGGKAQEEYDKIRKNVNHRLRKSVRNEFNYQHVKDFIDSMGITYASKGFITPAKYLGCKFLSAFLLMGAGFCLHPAAGVLLLFVGFKLPDMIAMEGNKKDNAMILEDIKDIFDILRLQTKAGVFLTNALSECYLTVKNDRLKQALFQMTTSIIAKHDIEGAVKEFKRMFDNIYINSFAISIGQSLETGQAAQMFSDMSKQIESIDKAIIISEREKIKKQVTAIQLLLYCGIIAAIIYIALLAFMQTEII